MAEEKALQGKMVHHEEFEPKAMNGMAVLLLNILVMITWVGLFVYGVILVGRHAASPLGIALIVLALIYVLIIGPIIFLGLKVLNPNEALVLTLFGKYYGSLKREGIYFVNPFVGAVNPTAGSVSASAQVSAQATGKPHPAPVSTSKKISLKSMTLNNDKQKINDKMGNPIIIGIVVIWRVVNTTKAVFNVDHYMEFLSIQCDSALRNIVRSYPYDAPADEREISLRGSSQEVAEELRVELQSKVDMAGLEIIEARITNLAYAPEIAAAMLQRQQASAIIDARQMIVEGAVGMVEMALAKLSENNIVQLDEERKAAMVSNLLVVLCGNRDVQPVVNSGTIY